jgi:hypothetical protein
VIPLKNITTSQHMINPQNVFLLPLHTELGLMKNAFKTVDQNGCGLLAWLTFQPEDDSDILL